MFDNFLIRKDSLKNDVDGNGNIIGFQFAARNANYRGVYLSLHNGYFIEEEMLVKPREVRRVLRVMEVCRKSAETGNSIDFE